MNEQVASQLESLAGLVSSLQKNVNNLNSSVQNLTGNTQNMTSSITDAEKKMGNFNKTFSNSQNAANDLNNSLENNLEKFEEYSTGMSRKVQKANNEIMAKYSMFFRQHEKASLENQRGLLGKFRDYANEQKEIFSNLESRRARLFFGFEKMKEMFKFLAGIGTSMFKIFTNVAGSVLNVAKFLVTLPLKSLESLLEIAHSIREEFLAISQTLEDTQEQISGTSRQGQGLRDLTSQVRGLGGAFLNVGSEAARTFGFGLQGQQAMIAKTAEKVAGLGTLANLYGTSYTRNGILVERAMSALGMSVEDNALLVRRSMSEGIHPFHALTRAINASTNASREFGIDQKQIAKGMNELRKNVIEFSHISEPELAGVVAQAAQLGIEAKELNAVFSKFTTFDQAAESAALLSQTFGMAVDAMDIIRAEDPMEIINQFREGMQQTGRDFKDLNRHEKALLSQYTGLSGEALQTAMSFEGIGLSYEELQQKMEENSPQAQLRNAVKEMSASIKEFMNVGKQLTNPFQAMSEGIKDAMVKNVSLQRSLMRLNSGVRQIYERVLNTLFSGETGRQIQETLENVINGFSRLFSGDAANNFAKLAQQILVLVGTFFDFDKGTEAMSKAFNDLQDTFFKNDFVIKLIDLGKIMIGNIVSGFIKSLPALLEGFTNLLNMFTGGLSTVNNDGLGDWFNRYVASSWNAVSARFSNEKIIENLIASFTGALGAVGGTVQNIGVKLGEILLIGIKYAWENSNIWSGAGTFIGGAIALTMGPLLALKIGSYLKSAVADSGFKNMLSKSGGFLAPAGRFLGAAVGPALMAKDAFDAVNEEETKGRDIGGLIGGGVGALGYIAGPLVGSLTMAAGNALGSVIGEYFEGGSNEQQNNEERRSVSDRVQQQSHHAEQIAESQNIAGAVSKISERPISINLNVTQMLDGDVLTSKILSAMLNGTTQYNVSSLDNGTLQITDRAGQGQFNPTPEGRA